MNIYITAMEIGYRENLGIDYGKLKKEIEDLVDIKFDSQLELVFIEWVINNFGSAKNYSERNYRMHLEGFEFYLNNFSHLEGYEESKIKYSVLQSTKFYMKGETVKQYLDYVELKESREQSKRAFQFSIGSIALAILSILLSWYLSTSDPKPPYDVKIIENKVQHAKLQNEIDSLNNELGKAEVLIDIYEEDNLK